MGSKILGGIRSNFQVGTLGYSLAYGGVCGIIGSGLVVAGRAGYVTFLDDDYYKDQSRQRYLDKQTVFFKELEETNKAHKLAAMASEYDPVATRTPFGALDSKYRF